MKKIATITAALFLLAGILMIVMMYVDNGSESHHTRGGRAVPH